MKKSLCLYVALSLFAFKAVALSNVSTRVSLKAVTQGKLTASDKIQFKFELFDEASKKSIGDQDLQDSHTKKLHMIAYDASLNEFDHVHPSFHDQTWSAEFNLLINGNYFIWAQGTLNDGTEFSASYKTEVINGKPALAAVPLGDARKAIVDHTVVELSKQKIRVGQMTMLDYKVTRDDGGSPQITPYLGANAHIIAVSPDGSQLIHAHPMAGNDASMGMIHTTFPLAGDYRLWVQLIDKGVLKTFPLSVTVQR